MADGHSESESPIESEFYQPLIDYNWKMPHLTEGSEELFSEFLESGIQLAQFGFERGDGGFQSLDAGGTTAQGGGVFIYS
ncbi:MAG: hypothetical protein EA353_05525 [Puniceicoccaceae bacterium]|nr:MAG: hypothetical protein EA353_05525 [Puniceicoccaceae bacterium]